MSSKKQKPYLVVLDVGHGSAAVLHDLGSSVIFDAGSSGAIIKRHLQTTSVKQIEAMCLSHADEDHIGGAVTLLMDQNLKIDEVLMNSDPKNTDVFEQLRYALAEAAERKGTKIDRRLATSTQFSRKGLSIEVLHPPDAVALSGVNGKSTSGKRLTSNSMSAAIRVSFAAKSSILLGGDIEYDCVDWWKIKGIQPTARVLVFPHHGGLPASSDADLFGYELTKLVAPDVVVFSNHRTKNDNPKESILNAITKAVKSIRFVCTQLPQKFHSKVRANNCWSMHQSANGKGIAEGSICLVFNSRGVKIKFGEKP